MAQAAWPWPAAEASAELRAILADSEGPLEPPIRAEIFGLQRFAQHGRSLGRTHRAARDRAGAGAFFPRLRSNVRTLRAAHRYIGVQAAAGYDISPAAEWLLDNFHLIEAQLHEIHEGLPRRYFRALPLLLDEPLAGLPRVYGIAWAFVAHTDGAFDEDLFVHFLSAYQETRDLDLSEMWALPTTLRVVLIENLRRVAERLALQKAARELADLCCDRIETASVESMQALLERLARRGLDTVFLAQVAQRLQHRRAASSIRGTARLRAWLDERLPDPAALVAQHSADQTADNLSVSNAVTSLRSIGDADWSDVVGRCSTLMRLLLTAPVFAAEHPQTRDRTLHAIERLALRSGRSELSVAHALLAHMSAASTVAPRGEADDRRVADAAGAADGEAAEAVAGEVAGYWLEGPGRVQLARTLGRDERLACAARSAVRRLALPVYLGALLAGTLIVILGLLLREPGPLEWTVVDGWPALLALAAMALPASEAVVAMINRLISESLRPAHLPRLALRGGIPEAHRTLVAMPAMLSDPAAIAGLAHRLHLHQLANPERHVQFALLTDWIDADTPQSASDEALLGEAIARVRELNLRHPTAGGAPRFILLHRARTFSASEQRWIGWERKRGKLEQLIRAIADASGAAFADLGELSRIEAGTRHVLTLDSDTQMPPGRLRELVGVAAHPSNLPRLDAGRRQVVAGYGILQPRLVTPLPAPRDFTLYHWLFAGHCGIDPYSAASSEVYQDVFDEGSFSGKGLLDVHAVHAVLCGRFPEGLVLSHDLIEGSLARCAAVSDITLIEEAPFHADAAATRVHRWTRGDWQLLPLLMRPGRHRLRGINRWKMFDNLRRSLVAPASLLLLVLALAGATLAPLAALALVIAAFSAGPLMGALAGCAPSRGDLAMRHFYRQAFADLARAAAGGLWHVAQLLQQALLSIDAIARALYRMLVSRRHLLQWTTAADAQAAAQTTLAALARRHWREPVVALALLGTLLAAGTPSPLLAALLCLTWAASPAWTWWVSRRHPGDAEARLSEEDRDCLLGVARDTWRFFERCVNAGDNHLPPDNLQLLPHDMVAHRTSPTNIGLYLLSVACARQFGWIGTQDMLARLEATLATLETMQRYRGHFLNWYDTQSCAPLLPMYVSTVDSGNLSGHLLAVAQACRERAGQEGATSAALALSCGEALASAVLRVEGLLGRWPELRPLLQRAGALSELLALHAPLAEAAAEPAAFQQRIDRAQRELDDWVASEDEVSPPAQPPAMAELQWLLGDVLSTLRSAWADARVGVSAAARERTVQRLAALEAALERLAWAPDFGFLYHPRRHLLHLGFRVAEQELDAGFYDLLASESRLTSLLAIAKGDVPVAHWKSLGRPFYVLEASAGLRSWSGSMFEYLMPALILDEPYRSVLCAAGVVAVREQIAYGSAQAVPWGISESAHAGRDHTLAYQYAPQGVPRLALRRTPVDELVVAPYATALAVQRFPHRASANFAALEALGARGRYGFIEAVDFTPARQATGDVFTLVATVMSHHQGMSIVALANALLGNPAQRWGMASAPVEAVASLLHERVPREISLLHTPPSGPLPQPVRQRAPALLRELTPGRSAVEPTHLLSNGRYCVALRANGAGWSRRGGVAITRARDDLLRDAHGSFFYVRWQGQPEPVSITQHPAPDPGARYQAVFHADRVVFDAAWPGLRTHMTVWVSPEDDIEFRQVEVHNASDRALDIELMSAFEVTLSAPAADESHPAFMNLFVRARWDAAQQALRFARTPRLPTEAALQAAHFLVGTDAQVLSVRVQTDRQRWLGRNHPANRPLASFDALPPLPRGAGDDPGGGDGGDRPGGPPDAADLDTGLDPVCALAVRLRVAPGAKARLTFATAASEQGETLDAMIDKYRQAGHVERASLMSATLSGIRLHVLRLAPANFAAIQSLTTALVATVSRPLAPTGLAEAVSADACDRRLLWRFGISGTLPLVLVRVDSVQGMGLVRALAQALRIWSWGGVACDVVVVSGEATSYQMPLQQELVALRDRHAADGALQGGAAATGLYVLRAGELAGDELAALRSRACIAFDADGRPLAHRVREWLDLHEHAREERRQVGRAPVPVASVGGSPNDPPRGRFTADAGAFEFDVRAGSRPLRPWINVLANVAFGAQVSESGGGYTWASNSRLHQLTGWCNDPVADAPSEWFLLQDPKSGKVWSVAPSAWGEERVSYRVSHGQGYTVIRHRRGELEVMACWCVDAQAAVKQVSLRLLNHGTEPMHLRLIGIAEWVMGAGRTDRATLRTSVHRAPLALAGAGADRGSAQVTAVLATQCERSAGFGEGTAFLAITAAADSPFGARGVALRGAVPGAIGRGDWTSDRRECFDARGRLEVPDRFGERAGFGLDPCAALSVEVALAPGAPLERVFLLGHANSLEAARRLAVEAAAVPALERLDRVRAQWDELLGAIVVETPDPLFDVLVNRWLLYQAVACRIWAKAGFYQAGGATGYRDQLQDAMALAWPAPQMLRAQIMLCASRQFPEGDVQHWWHAPTGAGVRTRFSDDLLWLPHACVHYLRATGDSGLLDEPVAFIEGAPVPDGAEDAYYVPSVSPITAPVYEHAARAIDRSLGIGVHGLPLMGAGDWNDGMNRVGHEGRGESVWLGWFLCRLVADFAPIAHRRGDVARAQRWERAARGWQQALAGPAWDGHWYRRAFFDDGQALGSQASAEARIDLIAQAWAVLSGVAAPDRQRQAMASVEALLVDHRAGLIRLLDPPLAHARPSAGYIQAYPPGVRENGGQYSHAGVWALMAHAARAGAMQGSGGDRDIAWRYFTWLSPAHRSADPVHGKAYLLEPYAMAGDIYSQPPYVGRGGWSWYTGAAAWLHRAAVESIFGLQLEAHSLSFAPCLPTHWPQATLILRRDGRTMRFVLCRSGSAGAPAAVAGEEAQRLLPGQTLDWRTLGENSCFLIPLDAPVPATALRRPTLAPAAAP